MKLILSKITLFNILLISLIIGTIFIKSYCVKTINFDFQPNSTLVVGDSNPMCAINDSLIKDTKTFASSGESYVYSFIKIKHVINNNPQIDTVILSFGTHNIFGNRWLWEEGNINQKYPAYFSLMTIQEAIKLFKLKPKSYLGSFNETPNSILSFFNNDNSRLLESYGRYKFLKRSNLEKIEEELEKYKSKDFTITQIEVNYLDSIKNYLNKKDVQLIFLYTPHRKEELESPYFPLSKYYKFYNTYHPEIPLIDLSAMELHDSCYGDLTHVNYKGARVISNLIAKKGWKGMLNSEYRYEMKP